jgi:Putative zinc-finger
MTCHELDARLDDWVDGSLPAAEMLEVEAHLASCPACRESERRLRQVLAHAAALPSSQSPSRDLWPEIAERLARERAWAWVGTTRGALALAAAATVLVGIGALLWVQRAPTPARMVEIPASSPPLVFATKDGPPLADPVLASAEREYELAANTLLEALQQRRPALRPETLEKIEGNLEVIDRALTEVRQALVKDPDNPELNRMLVATHRKKLDVLRRVVKLSTAL